MRIVLDKLWVGCKNYTDLVGFGEGGWGRVLIAGAGVTSAIAVLGFLIGSILGSLVAWAKMSPIRLARGVADAYTTTLRGVPDLLVIYLLYFGGNSLLSTFAGFFGANGFVGMPMFATGVLAIGIISAAYQAEVLRGAFNTVAKGSIEAAHAVGVGRWLLFRRVVAPQVLHYALPGLGNTWQLALKETALISVVGLVELLRQAQMASGSTRRPFEFFITAGLLYLTITVVSSLLFRFAEYRSACRMGG